MHDESFSSQRKHCVFLRFTGLSDENNEPVILVEEISRQRFFKSELLEQYQEKHFIEGTKTLVYAQFVSDYLTPPDRAGALHYVSEWFRGNFKAINVGRD